MTATAAAAAFQELSQSGKSPDPSRAETKYPVQESLTSIIFRVRVSALVLDGFGLGFWDTGVWIGSGHMGFGLRFVFGIY